MPSWNEVVQEMQTAGQAVGLQFDLDSVRRAKIRAVEQLTGRPLIVYAVDMSHPEKTANRSFLSMINQDDKDGFLEAMRGIKDDNLDILLQSPGGLAEAAESIVALLRSRFKHVRFIIPSIAKSAATMLAMSGDELLLGTASELGPIDPQLVIGGKAAPAQAILEQFQMAKDELQRNPAVMSAWLPILQQYGPALLLECQHHMALSEELVSIWLASYMFKDEADAVDHARQVAQKLNNHAIWRSHARRIDITWLTSPEVRLKVTDLASDPHLDDAVRALDLAIKITFSVSTAFKIVENGKGDALIGHASVPINVSLMVPAEPTEQAPAKPNLAPQKSSTVGYKKRRKVPAGSHHR
jgi:hypothetical protein